MNEAFVQDGTLQTEPMLQSMLLCFIILAYIKKVIQHFFLYETCLNSDVVYSGVFYMYDLIHYRRESTWKYIDNMYSTSCTLWFFTPALILGKMYNNIIGYFLSK